MTKIINLYGGPGTGKSTTAALVFALLKEKGTNVELVREYVKQWAWESRQPVNYDQFYFFGKQSRAETSLFNKVDLVVTDAPVAIACMYAEKFGSPFQGNLFRQMFLVREQMCAQEGHESIHIFLKRTKPYNPAGRFQTEEQAKVIDLEMRIYLKSLGINYIEIPADSNAADSILQHLNNT